MCQLIYWPARFRSGDRAAIRVLMRKHDWPGLERGECRDGIPESPLRCGPFGPQAVAVFQVNSCQFYLAITRFSAQCDCCRESLRKIVTFQRDNRALGELPTAQGILLATVSKCDTESLDSAPSNPHAGGRVRAISKSRSGFTTCPPPYVL